MGTSDSSNLEKPWKPDDSCVEGQPDQMAPVTSTPADELLETFKKYIGVREVGGPNKGADVERFQKAVDGKAQGESWCMAFSQFCIKEVEDKLAVKSPVYKSEHCLTVWNQTSSLMRLKDPEPGCLIIWRHGKTASGHVGVVELVNGDGTVGTIEGNTGPGAGVVREGDGVYRRTRAVVGTADMPGVGFLRVLQV